MSKKISGDDLLTSKEAAAILGIHPATLDGWRSRKTGPVWIKLGKKPRSPVRYKRSDIDDYLEAGRVELI